MKANALHARRQSARTWPREQSAQRLPASRLQQPGQQSEPHAASRKTTATPQAHTHRLVSHRRLGRAREQVAEHPEETERDLDLMCEQRTSCRDDARHYTCKLILEVGCLGFPQSSVAERFRNELGRTTHHTYACVMSPSLLPVYTQESNKPVTLNHTPPDAAQSSSVTCPRCSCRARSSRSFGAAPCLVQRVVRPPMDDSPHKHPTTASVEGFVRTAAPDRIRSPSAATTRGSSASRRRTQRPPSTLSRPVRPPLRRRDRSVRVPQRSCPGTSSCCSRAGRGTRSGSLCTARALAPGAPRATLSAQLFVRPMQDDELVRRNACSTTNRPVARLLQ